MWRCGRGSFWGLTSSPQTLCPAALQPCFHVSPLSRQAALVYLNIGRSHRVNVRKRTERHSSLSFFFFLLFPPFHLPWLHPCQPKPSRLSLTGEVINFIYTLIRCSDKTLSLWVAGVKGLWGSACQSVLKFSRLIATHRQRRDGAIPSRP